MSLLGAMMPAGRIERKVKPHPYQLDFHRNVEDAFTKCRKVLAVLPTGGGKTISSGEVVAREIEAGNRVLFLAHTRKLVTQYRQSLADAFGIWGEVEMGQTKADTTAPLICSTVQSMNNRVAKGKFSADEFSLIVIDEAHRSLSEGYKQLTDHFDAKILGLTATPRRGDQRDLMDFFDEKAIDIPLSQLIRDGYLSRLVIKNLPIDIQLVGASKTGDFTDGEVAHAISPLLGQCADMFAKEAKGRCSLVFLPLIEISKEFTALLCERGIKAEHVDGQSGDLAINGAISRLERGEIDCICNSMVLSEGVDIKPVNLIMNLRPTRSWTLYTQICGRGTRTWDEADIARTGSRWPVKTDCVLLDPLWQCAEHSLLQRPACLVAGSFEEGEELDEAIARDIKSGGSGDLMKAVESVRQSREDALRKRLAEAAKRRERLIDAMELFVESGQLDLAEYEPISKSEALDITDAQRNVLIRAGVDLKSITSRGHAGKVIDAIISRREKGLSTLAQAKTAKSMGMADAWQRSFDDVSSFITTAKSGADPYAEIPD